MRLALRNILHDRLRFLITAAGIAFSAFLMVFQGSLLAGFERAASRVIDSIDADLWMMPRGVQSFDFAPPFRSDYSGMVNGVPGIVSIQKIATGFAFWQRPAGTRKTIVVIGGESGLAGDFPISTGTVILPENVLVDGSDLVPLGLSQLPADIEINEHRRHVAQALTGFGSFLGSPYVFSNLTDARKCLGIDEDGSMFLVLRVGRNSNVNTSKTALRERFPELDVLTKSEFATRAQTYWTTQTGAGGALLTAAILGFLVGVLIVSQTVYATTMENLEEFATLKALGASRWFIMRMVIIQALISAACGGAAGILSAFPVMSLAKTAISWIYTPWQLPAAIAAATVLLAALASITAVRAAISIEPGRVFRV
jgi:putative ABC transport system permease protein